MQIGYGILLEGEIYNFMRGMELLLFNKFNLRKGLYQPPHITIQPPFETNDVSVYQDYLDELCQNTKPFEIELNGFNCFGNKVIYLDVQVNQKLQVLYETVSGHIKTRFNPKVKDNEMIFHATLAYGDMDSVTFTKAYEYLRANYHPQFKFKTQKIGLFYQLPDDSGWIVIKEKPLYSDI